MNALSSILKQCVIYSCPQETENNFNTHSKGIKESNYQQRPEQGKYNVKKRRIYKLEDTNVGVLLMIIFKGIKLTLTHQGTDLLLSSTIMTVHKIL